MASMMLLLVLMMAVFSLKRDLLRADALLHPIGKGNDGRGKMEVEDDAKGVDEEEVMDDVVQ
jgi:hypothetical protein